MSSPGWGSRGQGRFRILDEWSPHLEDVLQAFSDALLTSVQVACEEGSLPPHLVLGRLPAQRVVSKYGKGCGSGFETAALSVRCSYVLEEKDGPGIGMRQGFSHLSCDLDAPHSAVIFIEIVLRTNTAPRVRPAVRVRLESWNLKSRPGSQGPEAR